VRFLSWTEIDAALAARPPLRVEDAVSRRAAVALILRDGEAGIEILFIRRAEDARDPWSGQMAFPGGRSEPSDDHLQATAVRETLEEIGVDLASNGQLLGALDEARAMARMRPMDLVISPFVFRLSGSAAMEPSAEVRSVHWLPLADLLGPRFRSSMRYPHEGSALEFPCLRVEGVVIWGLTYRMFAGFGERLAAFGAQDASISAG
jgi:8-oxo-dGTP pyrophosphatase MutT (NUDIX family)